MKGVLKQMIEIYQPNGIDWMDVRLTRHNPYTFITSKKKEKVDYTL